MSCNIKGSNRLISGAVSRHKPDDRSALVEQQSGAVCAERKSSRAVLSVHLHDFLPRLLTERLLYVKIRVYHRIVKWIAEIVHNSTAFLPLL